MRLSEAPVDHYNHVQFEKDELEKRIEEESGPVKTYQAIEWFSPDQGKRSIQSMRLTIHDTYLWLNTRAYEALGKTKRINVGWDNLENALVIVPSESGKFSARAKRFGGTLLVRRVLERGFNLGVYDVAIDGNRMIVRPEGRVKS